MKFRFSSTFWDTDECLRENLLNLASLPVGLVNTLILFLLKKKEV